MGLTKVVELALGGEHDASEGTSCARRSTGEILCWGQHNGILGDFAEKFSPVPIMAAW